MTERTKTIKGLISGQVDMGTFGLVELELLAIEKDIQSLTQCQQEKEEQRLYAVFSVYGDDFTRRSIWFNSKNEAESYKNDNRMVRREYVIFEKTLNKQ